MYAYILNEKKTNMPITLYLLLDKQSMKPMFAGIYNGYPHRYVCKKNCVPYVIKNGVQGRMSIERNKYFLRV